MALARVSGLGLLRSYLSSYARVVAVQCCRDRQCYSTVNGDADGIVATRDDGADQLREPDMKEITRSTSSLRVDAIAAAGLGLSRRCPGHQYRVQIGLIVFFSALIKCYMGANTGR